MMAKRIDRLLSARFPAELLLTAQKYRIGKKSHRRMLHRPLTLKPGCLSEDSIRRDQANVLGRLNTSQWQINGVSDWRDAPGAQKSRWVG
jgi:hypothetical protein